MISRSIAILTLVFSGVAVSAPPVVAQTNISSNQATRVVDVSGRQRMLSQRIVKSACLTSAGINFGANFAALADAYDEFQVAQEALINGSSELDLIPTSFPEATDDLRIVRRHWQNFAPVVDQIMASGDLSTDDILRLDVTGLQVLTSMNTAVGTIAKVYAEQLSNVTVGQTITVDIAGRQRMLTQKMTKEICLMLKTGTPNQDLANTVALFDASLTALIEGLPSAGVIAPPNTAIRAKLMEVKLIWASLKPFADASATGQIPDQDSLTNFSTATETLLVTMNEAVGLYSAK